MALIKSISGFRGTIGGKAGSNLTPQDIVECTAAYGSWLKQRAVPAKVVIGRDARPSGELVSNLVAASLQSVGLDVIDLGLSTTPTVEMAVTSLGAGGGIILTASHNPKEWNALKLLNEKGEFISAADGASLLELLDEGAIDYVAVDELGTNEARDGMIEAHVHQVLDHPQVEVEAIRERKFHLVLDAVNSTGALAIPVLAEALGCTIEVLNGEMNGQFAHNPEPLPQHLEELCQAMSAGRADLGVAVDPDVDRLALVGPGGRWIGEEYTLVTVADYVLPRKPGPVVSNLSSSRALRDLAAQHACTYYASAVGEVNVVNKMKEVGAVIGGEGNGGIIDPALHYGRDALIGLALVLSHMATSGRTINELRSRYANYEMVKDKLQLQPQWDIPAKLARIQEKYREEDIQTIDGVKIDFPEGWVHLRQSNTEPIMRIYAESASAADAQRLAEQLKKDFE